MSCRSNFNRKAADNIKKNLKSISKSIASQPGITTEADIELALKRIIIIKEPSGNNSSATASKGILLLKFTESFIPFINAIDVEELLKKFTLIIEPSWSGYPLEDILIWCNYNENIYIESAEEKDYLFISSLESNLIPIRCGSGDWVDYRVFSPRETNKIYESVYVANFTPIKRIHIYLRAIAEFTTKYPESKFALVCSSWGPLKKNVMKLIKLYSLLESIDLFESIGHEELNDILTQSKANVLLSLREGSNRSLFESMFSNIPAVVLDNNVGVNKNHFVESSGMVVKQKELANAFEYIHSSWTQFEPRDWAMKNIAPEVTLDKIIKTIESQESIIVDRSTLKYKVNNPEASYMFIKDELTTKEIRNLLTLAPKTL